MLSLCVSAGRSKLSPVLIGIFLLCCSFIAGLFHFPFNFLNSSSRRNIAESCQLTTNVGITYKSLKEFQNKEINKRLAPLLARKAGAGDPDLIRLIRDMLDPPCSHWRRKNLHPAVKTLQASVVDDLLKKRDGFFIECGAVDGEKSSNTLYLEITRRWKGLLVEVDPYYYTQLVGKCRSVWSINACLSTTRHVQQLLFMESKNQNPEVGRMMDPTKQQQQPGKTDARDKLVPCFPLDAILEAINQTRVDYFSLDVEGMELEVLNTIPFNKIDIQTLSLEYFYHRTNKQAYVDFMATRGYKLHKEVRGLNELFAADYIFTKTKFNNTVQLSTKSPKRNL